MNTYFPLPDIDRQYAYTRPRVGVLVQWGYAMKWLMNINKSIYFLGALDGFIFRQPARFVNIAAPILAHADHPYAILQRPQYLAHNSTALKPFYWAA